MHLSYHSQSDPQQIVATPGIPTGIKTPYTIVFDPPTGCFNSTNPLSSSLSSATQLRAIHQPSTPQIAAFTNCSFHNQPATDFSRSLSSIILRPYPASRGLTKSLVGRAKSVLLGFTILVQEGVTHLGKPSAILLYCKLATKAHASYGATRLTKPYAGPSCI